MTNTESTSTEASDRPMTLAEIAAFYREGQRTTRARIERGELKPLRLPSSRRLLFDPAAVRSLLDSEVGR